MTAEGKERIITIGVAAGLTREEAEGFFDAQVETERKWNVKTQMWQEIGGAMKAEVAREMESAKRYRMLRVLEYVGTEDFIRSHREQRFVKVIFTDPKRNVIREAILGDTSEILTLDESVIDAAAAEQAKQDYDFALNSERRRLGIIDDPAGEPLKGLD